MTTTVTKSTTRARKPAVRTRTSPRISPGTAPRVRDWMTIGPWTIGARQPLVAAHVLMREHRIRHLPVLEGGHLVGVISERDVAAIEALDTTTPGDTKVEEAMTTDIIVAAPDDPLAEVAGEMARRKAGSVIVADGDKVLGVLTTVDALRALASLAAGH